MPKYQKPKGTYDILPQDSEIFKYIEKKVHQIAEFYGFNYIETPIIEKTELFIEGVGEGTDIVEKEMYSFKTKGGDNLTLRPEGTAPVIRAYIEHGLRTLPHPLKLYYYGNFFRHEKPQRLRYRQFKQAGFEIIGSSQYISDAEIIFLVYNLLKEEFKLEGIYIKINSIGCQTCRREYLTHLLNYIKPLYPKFPKIAKEKIKKNILKVFDIKEIKVKQLLKDAPQIIDYLCVKCKRDFENILDMLDFLSIKYEPDPYLVRGLDYYTNTIYEFYTQKDKKNALGGGGRYNLLVKALGGPNQPACGAAIGIERIVEFIKNKEELFKKETPKVFIAHLGELGRKYALKLIEEFRKNNIQVSQNFGKQTLKSQIKFSKRIKPQFLVICAQKELIDKKVIVRNIKEGEQKEIELKKLIDYIKSKL